MNANTGRAIVTGGAGFLGSHLVERLAGAGCKHVTVPRTANCDLLDGAGVRRLYDEVRPEIVFHLAARVGGIGANQKNPGSYFHDNMLMGLNVIEQARLACIPKVVMVGTICAYPKFAPIPPAHPAQLPMGQSSLTIPCARRPARDRDSARTASQPLTLLTHPSSIRDRRS